MEKVCHVEVQELLYENPLCCEEDIQDFILEGQAKISFPEGRMRLENALDAEKGQKANYVLWCPEEFPSDVLITWEFMPLREPGLCILFFAAAAKETGKKLGEKSHVLSFLSIFKMSHQISSGPRFYTICSSI